MSIMLINWDISQNPLFMYTDLVTLDFNLIFDLDRKDACETYFMVVTSKSLFTHF